MIEPWHPPGGAGICGVVCWGGGCTMVRTELPMDTLRTRAGLAVVLLVGLAGCASRPAEQAAEKDGEYLPYADRPLSGAEYWAKRAIEDRIEREHERRTTGR